VTTTAKFKISKANNQAWQQSTSGDKSCNSNWWQKIRKIEPAATSTETINWW